MTTLCDLEPFPFEGCDCLRSVGWIGTKSAYSTGEVAAEFFRKLCELIQNPWEPFAAAGMHDCELCRFTQGGTASFEGMQVPARSGTNVFVPHGGVIYIAPVLVAHYIDAHGYKPPDEFMEAVLACPAMRSMAYHKALLANGGRGLVR